VLLPQVLLVLPLGEVLIHSLMLMYSIIAVVLRYISTVRSAHNGDCLLKIDGLLVNGQPSYSIQHIIYNITHMINITVLFILDTPVGSCSMTVTCVIIDQRQRSLLILIKKPFDDFLSDMAEHRSIVAYVRHDTVIMSS
jgi:hypothetical protein